MQALAYELAPNTAGFNSAQKNVYKKVRTKASQTCNGASFL